MQLLKRVSVYILGLFIMAVGVSLSINNGLGVSPINSLPYVIHYVSGISIFVSVTAVLGFYVVLQFVLLRREFKWKNLLQIVFSTLFGFFTNFLAGWLKPLTPASYPGKLLVLAICIVCIALGIFLYLQVDIVPMPLEGLALTIAAKTGKPFYIIKIILDVCSVTAAVSISLLATGRLNGVREGTIAAALLVGRVAGWLAKLFAPGLDRFCFGPGGKPEKIPPVEKPAE